MEVGASGLFCGERGRHSWPGQLMQAFTPPGPPSMKGVCAHSVAKPLPQDIMIHTMLHTDVPSKSHEAQSPNRYFHSTDKDIEAER